MKDPARRYLSTIPLIDLYPAKEEMYETIKRIYTVEELVLTLAANEFPRPFTENELIRQLDQMGEKEIDPSRVPEIMEECLRKGLIRTFGSEETEKMFLFVNLEEMASYYLRLDESWNDEAREMWNTFYGELVKFDLPMFPARPFGTRKFRVLTLPGGQRRVRMEKDVEDPRTALPTDDVISMIRKQEQFALSKCLCREAKKYVTENYDCSIYPGMCLYFNEIAAFNIKLGVGREITQQEAIDYVLDCRKHGLVQYASNVSGPSYVMCNCCKDCCQLLKTVQDGNLEVLGPSRYRSVIDHEVCISCGKCADICPVYTITEKDGTYTVGEKCIGCGLCEDVCPEKAAVLVLRENADSLVPEYEDYDDFELMKREAVLAYQKKSAEKHD